MNLNEQATELSDSQVASEVKEWYKLSNKEICSILDTNQNTGLSATEVEKRLVEFGRNTLPKAKKPNWFTIFLKTFLDPLSAIMLFAGLLQIVVFSIAKEITAPDIAGLAIICLIVLTNSIIATVQEVKSINQISSLNENKQFAIVLRNSKKMEVDIEELVPGDIVFVNSGGFVPADIRIIQNQVLRIDESALTGENEPVKKVSDPLFDKSLMLGDQKNIAFMSTLVLEGKLMGVVFGTGNNSEIGKIASKITEHNQVKTPLERKVIKLTALIGLTSIFLGLILFLTSYLGLNHKLDPSLQGWNKLLLIAVSAAISVIPESLTIIVKICLMVATKKMAIKNVIIKNPKSIETLGNVNVICTDKTGTLTENKMSVDKIYINFKELEYKDFDPENSMHLINCIALCSDAVVEKEKIGSATEIATLNFVKKFDIKYLSMRKKHKRLDEIPFDSKRKMMTTVNEVDGEKIVYTKGAVDYLLKKCKFKSINNEVSELTDEDKKKIEEQLYSFARKGLRVLGFSYKNCNDKKSNYESNLIFLGCVAIMDPPREQVKESIVVAKEGGIRVIMITGDHKITAFEIATRLGIADEIYNTVITGAEIEELTREELKEKLKTTNVFARVNPEHKALIVDLLQEDHNIVAMTGDGVNDSPSLVKADVGISMGITGTEVAKEVSDVILADDNFKSIISGVNSGRNVYEKIKYSISFLIAANLSQVLTLLLILAFYQDLALNSVNILFHIFVVETIVAIPIGMQRERKGVMQNLPPLNKKESLLKGIVVQIILTTLLNTLFAVFNYQISLWFLADDENLAREFGKTGTYIAIMLAPIFYAILYNNFFLPIEANRKAKGLDRYKPNRWLLILMCFALFLSLITLIPVDGLNEFFDFKTTEIPVGLIIIFIINAMLPTVFIFLIYKILIVLLEKKSMKVANK